MVTLKQRSFTKGNYTYIIKHVLDEGGDIEYLRGRLKELSRRRQHLDDSEVQEKRDLKRRIQEFDEGKWHMIGITVDVIVKTKAGWSDPPHVGRAALWGIESDAGDAYTANLERDLINEANEDVEYLRDALAVRAA